MIVVLTIFKLLIIFDYCTIQLYCICRDWVLALLLGEKRIQAQLAQYNKFVESRFKNQVSVRIATTGHDHERIELQMYKPKLKTPSSGFSSEKLNVLIISLRLGYNGSGDNTCCSPFFLSLHGEFLTLYSPSQLILTLHLLIMQITTRVLVPSATFPNFLLVAATNPALFRGPFLINATRMLVGRIQSGGDSFSLNRSYTVPPCASHCTRPSF